MKAHPGTHFVEGFALLEVDLLGVSIVGRGDTRDLAAQMMIEGAHDWRRRDQLQGRDFAGTLPDRPPAFSRMGAR